VADDRLAEELAAIREHASSGKYYNPALLRNEDVPRLLAAVEAVLKLHQPGPVLLLGTLCKNHADYRFFSIDSTEQERVRACPDCQAVLHIHCTCGSGRFDRCRARVAITSALLSEENPGEP
jgi:hypothetical protein